MWPKADGKVTAGRLKAELAALRCHIGKGTAIQKHYTQIPSFILFRHLCIIAVDEQLTLWITSRTDASYTEGEVVTLGRPLSK